MKVSIDTIPLYVNKGEGSNAADTLFLNCVSQLYVYLFYNKHPKFSKANTRRIVEQVYIY